MMGKTQRICVVIGLLAVLASACAGKRYGRQSISFYVTSIRPNVMLNATTVQSPPIQNFRRSENNYAVAVAVFDDVDFRQEVRFRWYDNYGTLYSRGEQPYGVVIESDGRGRNEQNRYVAWCRLDPQGLGPANIGTWRVVLEVNGEERGQVEFYMD
jgi:hypothetical protein